MGNYANSGGKNKGKKYKKLTGYEIATPQSTKRARAFMLWYGRNYDRLRLKLRNWDDEIATDTALKIYEAIELKDLAIESYKHYYFRAYHTNAMKHRKDETAKSVLFGPVSVGSTAVECDNLAAPTFDFAQYESASDALNTKIMEYVRAKYPPFETSIFEIFIGLQPDISCRGLSIMLGLSTPKVWEILSIIRKDVSAEFRADKDYLLSLLK